MVQAIVSPTNPQPILCNGHPRTLIPKLKYDISKVYGFLNLSL